MNLLNSGSTNGFLHDKNQEPISAGTNSPWLSETPWPSCGSSSPVKLFEDLLPFLHMSSTKHPWDVSANQGPERGFNLMGQVQVQALQDSSLHSASPPPHTSLLLGWLQALFEFLNFFCLSHNHWSGWLQVLVSLSLFMVFPCFPRVSLIVFSPNSELN